MWQSDVRSCIMPRQPRHLVQKLNVGTVYIMDGAVPDSVESFSHIEEGHETFVSGLVTKRKESPLISMSVVLWDCLD